MKVIMYSLPKQSHLQKLKLPKNCGVENVGSSPAPQPTLHLFFSGPAHKDVPIGICSSSQINTQSVMEQPISYAELPNIAISKPLPILLQEIPIHVSPAPVRPKLWWTSNNRSSSQILPQCHRHCGRRHQRWLRQYVWGESLLVVCTTLKEITTS